MADKAIFLDRDGTLIEDPGYLNHPAQVKLLDGVAEALNELRGLGYKLIVVSNQSAVARGIVTEKVLGEIHDRLRQLLLQSGAYLDQIYYCPYHPDGVVPKYRKESEWRKPNPGMLLAAAERMNIDLSRSWCIGNSRSDVEAGLRAGCKTILIKRSPHYQQPQPGEPNPDYTAVNLKEAANIIKKCHRSPVKEVAGIQSAPTEQNQRIWQDQQQRPEHIETVEPPAEPLGLTEEPLESPTEPIEPPAEPPEQQTTEQTIEQLLGSILDQLKNMQRASIFSEFSIMRLIAGIVQITVLFCLLLSVWFLMNPNRQDNSVFISLGFAMVLQIMSLTFYVMQWRK